MRAIALVVALAGVPSPAAAADRVRVFVSVDMEGVAGVVTAEQLGPTGFDYAAARVLMTEEALAAVEGAKEGGATEVLVADSHGNMQNLLLDRLPADVQVVRGSPRPHGMMEGLDRTFAGVVFVGYHASTTNASGVRAHTFSSANLADVKVGGVSMSEGSWNAAYAGHHGVPVLAVTGDEAAVAEVKSLVKGVEGAVVKWPLGFHGARTLAPVAARALVKETVARAVRNRAAAAAHRVAAPVPVEVRFKSYRPAEVLAYHPAFTRVDAHAVRFTAKDMAEAYRILEMVLTYQPDLAP